MGKRVSVKQDKLPTVQVGKLRDPSERALKLYGAGLTFLIYAVIIVVTIFALEKTAPIGKNLSYWLIIGGVSLFIVGGGHKRRMLKAYPRSKVTGSTHQDVRIQLNQLCRLLDIKKPPEMYIVDSQDVAAVARGLTAPYLVVSSRLLQVLSPDEFRAMLASLLGHVKGGTCFWRTFVMVLTREAGGIWPIVCAPYLLVAKLLGETFLEATNHTADRVALLVLDGDYHLLTRTIIKLISYTSSSITDEQRHQLQGFLNKTGLEASAEDVEQQMILGRMLRLVPGLKERIDNLAHAEGTPAFEQQLSNLQARREKVQPATRP